MAEPNDKVNVLIAIESDSQQLEKIRGVSPRLKVNYVPFGRLNQVMEEMLPHLAKAEVLHTFRADFDPAAAPHLKWIQTPGAGVDYLAGLPILKTDVVITNAHVFSNAIAEYVFLSILSFRRNFPAMLADYQEHRDWPTDAWRSHRGTEISGSTLGIVGYGDIGRAVARIGKGFNMRIFAIRASARESYEEDGVQMLPPQELPKLLSTSDQIVLSLPITETTEKMIGEKELRSMKRSAYLVNVGRGKVIDEPVLVQALREGWIAGAGLDVFTQRPLPKDSPLFELPNVILTPHISGVSHGYEDRLTELFCENLQRYLNGEPLLNVVDKARGY